MHLPRKLRRFRPAGRRMVSVLVLVALAVATTGVPLPSWAGKDTSVPFPCMHRQCGCHNAAACWNSCCCHSNAQKLAWAKKNGVQAPTFVVAAAAREAKAGAATKVALSCCSSRPDPSAVCCSGGAKVAKSNVDPAKSCCKSQPQARGKLTSPDWLRLEDARRCQGQAELWMMLGQALLPEPEIQLNGQPLAHDWLVVRSTGAEILSSHPDERPPRVTL